MRALIGTMAFAMVMALAVTAQAQDAAALYKSKCQICHGPDGSGSVAGNKLGVKNLQSPEVRKQSDEDLFEVAKKGKNKMPAYDKKLTDDQIKGLIKFIRTLK
jgi:cytochrome c6